MSEESLPNDDVQSSGQSEQELLDAVMANSPMLEEAKVPLPNEEIPVDDPEELPEEDPEGEEAVSDEEFEEPVEELAADDESTQSEVYSVDDLDLDAQVTVKIDGEDLDVSFGDLIKGYTTEQSLSAKGRELGEARKAIEAERTEKLGQLDNLMAGAHNVLMQGEENLAKRYHNIEAKIKEARENGDTFELSELKDQREQAQANYWQARRQREALIRQAATQYQEVQAQQFQQRVESFYQEVPTLIPDFNEEVAQSIRQFAVDEGINPDILDTITDPAIVKFVDDYRRLKQNVSKGAAKRKATPTRKAIPAKKAKPLKQKQMEREQTVRNRAFREDASEADQMAWLKQHASKTLNL